MLSLSAESFRRVVQGQRMASKYGAPFVEEEWDNNELELVPQYDAIEEVESGDNAYPNIYDFQQILGSDALSNMAPPVKPQSADGSLVGEVTDSFGGIQNQLMSAVNCSCDPNMCYIQNMQKPPASYDIDDTSVKKECTGECSKSGDFDDLSFLLNEPFLDSLDKFADEGFIETNDLSNPFETNATAFDMLEEHLHTGDDSSFYFACDPSMISGSEDLASNQMLPPETDLGEGTEQGISPSGQLIDNNNFNAALSTHMPSFTENQSDFQNPFIKHATQKLGDIHAPPAYAAEFPSKDAVLRLTSAGRSPSSARVRTNQSLHKHDNFNIVLSFGFSHGDGGSLISMGWPCFISFCILFLSMSFSVQTYIRIK